MRNAEKTLMMSKLSKLASVAQPVHTLHFSCIPQLLASLNPNFSLTVRFLMMPNRTRGILHILVIMRPYASSCISRSFIIYYVC